MEYVASVEKALEVLNGGSSKCPPDELLPAELGAVASSKRQSSALVAVQTLVTSFIVTHNRLVSRLVSARDESRRQQQEIEQLKLCPVIVLDDCSS